jgi:hypothetical protein
LNNKVIKGDSNKNPDHKFTGIPLPQPFLVWQSQARLEAFKIMEKNQTAAVRSLPAHLPVLATFGEGDFPVNLTTRGIGLLPKSEVIKEITNDLENTIRDTQGKPWPETLSQRLTAIRKFYENPDLFDETRLGGLEIFEGQTLKNLKSNSRAALLYTGAAPTYASYQFNGIVQLINQDDPGYRFLLAARELFAQDAFHIHQIDYPYGYLFYPVEIKDKTPFPRRAH